jgi:hypothetical protein
MYGKQLEPKHSSLLVSALPCIDLFVLRTAQYSNEGKSTAHSKTVEVTYVVAALDDIDDVVGYVLERCRHYYLFNACIEIGLTFGGAQIHARALHHDLAAHSLVVYLHHCFES